MQFLNVNDLKNVNYIANGQLIDQYQDSVLMTKDEVKELLNFISDLETGVAPQVLGFLSKLQDFAQ